MSGALDLLSSVPLLLPTLRQATPLAIAAIGGVVSERSGVVNIALEGMMLVGAFTGVWAAQAGGPWMGLGCALLAGALMGLLHAALTQRLRMNHIVAGVAINILALNATTFLLRRLFHQAQPPRAASLPDALPIGLFIVGAAALAWLVHLALYRTAAGLRLRASGESGLSARMAGVNPVRLRVAAATLSGVLGALAGAYLSMSQVGRFTDDMVSGRGFIALAAVVCGRWTPLGAAAVCLAFGFFDALQIHLQGTVRLPGEVLRSLPYVFTILAATVLRPTPPAALGAGPEE